jgi:hypothetical protein
LDLELAGKDAARMIAILLGMKHVAGLTMVIKASKASATFLLKKTKLCCLNN